MGNLYLIDKPFGENGLALAQDDPEAQAVLIQDGVYLDMREMIACGHRVYAVSQDVEKRGIRERILPDVKLIDYRELVDLIVAHKVINFA